MAIPKGGIAFFDSGIGGLTVLAACEKVLPREIFLYYGDNRRAPYGNLPPKKIKKYVFRVFKKFQRWRVKAAVVACNTATAVCVEELRKKFPFPIVGAEPAVFSAAEKGGDIFVLSTRATYESERFRKLCEKAEEKFPQAKLYPFACDELAGEIERQLWGGKDYEALLPQGSPDAVVLGCTHYVYVKEQIQRFYGCPTVDGNEGIAARLKAVLDEKNPPRPLVTTKGEKRSKKYTSSSLKKMPTEGKRRGKKERDDKKSCPRKSRLVTGNQSQIFFLGKSKMVNETIFEQMFGLKVVFWGQKSQKFQKNSKKISKNP